MNPQEILRALQAGEISLEDAKKELQKSKTVREQPAQSIQPQPVEQSGNRRPSNQEPTASTGTGMVWDLGHDREKKHSQSPVSRERIAIIGMSGRYPGAGDLNQYWDNLVCARNSIREIPDSRWNVNQYYDPRPAQMGKIYCKWLGLLDDIEYFDPLFFNIAPMEAEVMDPQQRLFLQEGYKAFEDAGYGSEQLSNQKCGVYLGIMSNEYAMVLAQNKTEINNATGNSSAIAAARIPYFLNLKGPAISIDTACSSSLVAAYLACQALSNREIDMALIGGVTLYLIPEGYIGMCTAGMLSPQGQCKAFDNDADGFVPGEGVGALVLKRLSDAEADNDHIYGVIIGTGINQDGKTNGITAPSVNSQMELTREIYDKYNIDPASIGYVEMHGTGTKLGDPIELEALATVFQERTNHRNYCAIGSVKSNIGHTSAAAGVAGIQKILLCMQHKQLVPTLNFKKHNEHFNFKDSPFYVNTKLQPWEAAPEIPRRAGVSSFGFSGTNAHLVIEEYYPGTTAAGRSSLIGANKPILFVLSAKSDAQLKIYAESMKSWIESHEDLNLVDMAYTLQVGREAMDYRLAFTADSRAALLKNLAGYIHNNSAAGILTDRVKKSRDGVVTFAADEDAKSLLQTWIHKKKLRKIAELWVMGLSIDWNMLYDDIKPYRISLPTYPFTRERYWIPELESGGNVAENSATVTWIHPLLHQNTSNLYEQRFSSTFTGEEFFLADHVIQGQRIFPGVAYLEMARAAVALAAEVSKEAQTLIQLKNVVWIRPITVGEHPVRVHIRLFPEVSGEIAYEIYSESETDSIEAVIHSQGVAVLSPVTEVPIFDLPALQARCNRSCLSPDQCYEIFRMMGIEYGPGHRGIEKVYIGEGQVLAKLSLPVSVSDTEDQFVLHPSMMDSALQASLGLWMGDGDLSARGRPVFPFALQELEILGGCDSIMWALISYSDGAGAGGHFQKLDIDLGDDQGKIRMRMRGYLARIPEGEVSSPGSPVTFGTLLLETIWKEQTVAWGNVPQATTTPKYIQQLVMLCEPGDQYAGKRVRESIETQLNGVAPKCRCLILQSKLEGIAERFQSYAVQAFEEIQNLLNDRPKEPVLIQVVVPIQAEKQLFSGLSGLLKTARLENPKLIGQLIEVTPGQASETIIGILKENSRSPVDHRIRYQNDKRWITGWNEVETSRAEVSIPWKDRGVYLIAGGAGGLGLIFGREIARNTKSATLILTGRSPLNEAKQTQLKELRDLGARVEYKQVDVTDKKAVVSLIQSIGEDFGNLHGVIHSAGVIRDNFILKKTKEELQEVLAPKVSGLVNLDQAGKDLNLDFFILFSSIAGSLGNPGQADYSMANAFMDAYAEYRNTLVASKKRHGRTLAINWPLWQEGGMGAAEETWMMMQNMGIDAIQAKTGIQALYQGLASGKDQVMVIAGDLKRLRTAVLGGSSGLESVSDCSTVKSKEISNIAPDLLREKALNHLKKLLSSVIKLPVQRIEADVPLEKYGIDSTMILQLTDQLEKTFGSLSKTLLFEYQNLQALTDYFMESYHDRLADILGIEEQAVITSGNNRNWVTAAETVKPSGGRPRFASPGIESRVAKGFPDIAIIGVSGRYPGAPNIQEFWDNLRDGKDCITEIPKDRWDHSLYFDEDRNNPGKTYSKWGGFLEGVDQFDPLFFNISPREAEIMDPQERLFLECVYETLEDAGYTCGALSGHRDFGLESKVGVYVGVMYEEYQLYGAQEQIQGRPVTLSGNSSSIANRVSYFFNFHGPSMALDTMCSSSLTAIHLACQSLQRGGCELAIAGGVNVSVHPNKYLALGQGKFVSSKGRCESFGKGGDGYVPGEGVGAVLLKPLSKAIADGDHIYGVIKGTAINHGGKTNGYSVPNPNAQAEVIGQALKEAGIDPRTISYIEAHGTGTSLGDPIEIAGLTKTFAEYTKDKQFCAIGSAKSNIGHCESAAGIAGVTKVLLQLQNCRLVPSLHSEALNPNIDFGNTPFVVQQNLAEWKRPVIELNGATREYPRRAGISAFGAGGSNAHVIIEEYIPNNSELLQIEVAAQDPAAPVIIVLSAKDEERLKEQIQRLLAAITAQRFSDAGLASMAYTLQVGREAMEERLAVIVSTIKELEEKLKAFAAGQEDIPDLHRGQVKRNKETLAVFTADEELQEAIDKWIRRRKYSKLLDFWVKGLIFDWNKLYGNIKPGRISLPAYPFAKERYWVPELGTGGGSAAASAMVPFIHPLLQQNTSNLYEQRFSSTFTGREFFLTDHIVRGQRILPGVVYLEMARAAVTLAAEVPQVAQTGIQLKNMVWTRPVTVREHPVRVHIRLFPEAGGEFTYEIYSEPETDGMEPVIHSRGAVVLGPVMEAPVLDLPALQTRCNRSSLLPEQCYEAFRMMGINYGPGHRGIEQVYIGEGQVLAKLHIPLSVSNTFEQFVLHPSLMDSAIQASIGLMMDAGDLKPVLPFALQDLEIFKKCASTMWALIRYNNGGGAVQNVPKLDIDISDETGTICIRMKGFSFRAVEGDPNSVEVPATFGTLLLQPCWKERIVILESAYEESTTPVYAQHLVILCEMGEAGALEHLRECITTQMNGMAHGHRCLRFQSKKGGIAERFQAYTGQAFEEIQGLLNDKSRGKVLIQIVTGNQGEQKLCTGLIGLLTTARLENPKIIGQVIEMESGEGVEGIVAKLQENCLSPGDDRIRYQDGKRRVIGWNEVEDSRETIDIPWKDNGIYLITGGAGGLGLIFAGEIAHKVKNVTLILTGRSALSDDKQIKLEELRVSRAKVEYRQIDITQREAVTSLVQSIQDDLGSLNGVIHCAGVIRDNFITKKTREELQEVLAPKVNGLVNLDEACQDLSLDFLILFSSGAGVTGNIGQSDYATANAFMDAYSEYRNTLVAARQRYGRTISINWPLWQEGGMTVAEETDMMMQSMGMKALPTLSGIRALYQGLAFGKDQVLVLEGDLNRLRMTALEQSSGITNLKTGLETASAIVANKATSAFEQDLVREKAINYFKKLLSSVIKLPVDRIEAEAPLEKYGIDSVMVMQLTHQLEKTFGSLSKTLFFEYQNIQSLSEYFLESYGDQLADILGIGAQAAATTDDVNNYTPVTEAIISDSGVRKRSRFTSDLDIRIHDMEFRDKKVTDALDIAIIGLSGRYPGARNIQEFWKNLRDGKDCITEIPKDRWDYRRYFDEDRNKPGKTNSKWGGFLEGVTQFDPLFFNISPREAEIMDPQERLFLECVYETIEDAGYTRETLGRYRGFGLEGNVGVYVGVMYEEYQLYGAQEQLQGRPFALAGNSSAVANRVSYFCNFHGPSMTLDTMCSSSLAAIHLACHSLQRGECELAIAGGVNVSIHPNKYLMLGQAKFASSKGRCESFGEGADGYVPGEGVGAVLLKPLAKAVADGDNIYGVIKGTAINHGGKTNGYTVPNPNAQAEVIGRAIAEARIDPRTISYIEAHGTGTSLGDPIEITGLTKSFQKYTKDRQFCAIGSAKSNIGHCESAAGIAGVTKVLLQLKNFQLAPSLHSEPLNPNIDFSKTPFIVQRELAEWKQPVAEMNGKMVEYPRRAGISAFGAGGSNAHIVIEEYIPKDQERRQIAVNTQNPAARFIIVLSAKNEERLKERGKRLLAAIIEQQYSDVCLADMAYTLQVGREAMEERLAMVVKSIEELKEKLKSYIADEDDIEDFYRGQVKRNQETVAVFTADEELQEAIDKWIQHRKYGKLLDLWVKGLIFDWNKLYGARKPRRISLPAYPFAKNRYWVPELKTEFIGDTAKAPTNTTLLHPLLHQNTSDFLEQRFSSTFTGEEFFLADHTVKGQLILPGAASLEMARAAVAQAARASIDSQTRILLKNVVWTKPIIVMDRPVQVHIGLTPANNGEINYKIYNEPNHTGAEPEVYSRGSAVLSSVTEALTLDLNALQAQCKQSNMSLKQFYEAFRMMGIDYGPGYQGIEKLYIGLDKVLAKLALPPSVAGTSAQFVLHPSLIDSAVQASVGLMLSGDDNLSSGNTLPLKAPLLFALQELEITGNCTSTMWALIRNGNAGMAENETRNYLQTQKLDIDLCDDNGVIRVRMKGVTSRILDGEFPTGNLSKPVSFKTDESPAGTTMVTPVWDLIRIEKSPAFPAPTHQVVMVGGTQANRNFMQRYFPKTDGLDIGPGDTIDTIASNLESCGVIDSILWIAPYHPWESLTDEALIEDRNWELLRVFKMIQALIRLGYHNSNLSLLLITTQAQPVHQNDGVNLSHAALYEWISSLAKHYPNWKLRLMDMEVGCDWPDNIFTLPPGLEGNSLAYRKQRWHLQRWIPYHCPPSDRTLYKTGGVYLIIGDMNGIGAVWSEYMIRVYQSRIIWISRYGKDEAMEAPLDSLIIPESAPLFIKTNLHDRKALQQIYDEIKQRYSRVHGLVHISTILPDQNPADMEEQQFLARLAAQFDENVRIAQVFHSEPFDFVMFLSFMNPAAETSKSSSPTGATFPNVFARQLARELSCPVKTAHWAYSEAWEIQSGPEVPEAVAVLESILAGPVDQITLVKAAKLPAMEEINPQESIVIYPENHAVNIQNIKNRITTNLQSPNLLVGSWAIPESDTGRLRDKAQIALQRSVSQLLNVDIKDIDIQAEFTDYGFDPVILAQLAEKLNREYQLELTTALLLEYPTLSRLGEYLGAQYRDVFLKL